MENLLLISHVLVCLFLVAIVLLQHGKGADIGATFGGSSQSLFGTEGPLPLLNKITTLAAIVFMLTSVSLAYISTQKSSGSVMKSVVVEQPVAAKTATDADKASSATPSQEESQAVAQEAPAEQEEQPAK